MSIYYFCGLFYSKHCIYSLHSKTTIIAILNLILLVGRYSRKPVAKKPAGDYTALVIGTGL